MSELTQHAIVGTAGHIDHGKTALVRALTGHDTDTLAEEKRRGITIELGFAFMETPGFDKQIIFIDVPGHEKLIKTMVAGASNLDAALLVIAADEGINVQTREHFDILKLLGIENGVVALTKLDLVDADRVATVTADIKALAEGSFLQNAPIVPVSSITGEGVEAVKAALVEAARKMTRRADSGIFRMPVDRVFTMHGFGTVVAGTILSGEVKVGDKLEVLPDGLQTRVRGVQVHAKSVQKSDIGKRTAINLADIKKDQLRRGQVVCAPSSLVSSTRMDVTLQVLSSFAEPLKNRTRVRFHVGTDEVMARLVLLEDDRVEPGASSLAQLVLETATVAVPKDRFVIRAFSSMQTIGGGVILDAHAKAHKRFDEAALDSLEKRQGDINDVVEQAFAKASNMPLSVSEAATSIGESEDDVRQSVDELRESGDIKLITPRAIDATRDLRRETYIHRENFEALADKLLAIMTDYFSRNPYRLFMNPADLQSRFLKLATRPVYEAILIELRKIGTLTSQDGRVGIAGRDINWRVGERQLADRIEKMFLESGFSSPPEYEVLEDTRVREDVFENMMTALLEQKRLIRISDKVTYHTQVFEKARALVVDHIKAKGGITAGELRDLMNVTRKYSISLLEYLDDAQVTKRLEEKRVLR